MPVQKIALTALFVTLTVIGAFIQIPTAWVSFTLQILFVFLAGALLGPKYGALSQIVYVVLGLAGFHVFTKGGGIGYVFQPSFGFLLGYIPGAFIVGKILEKKKAAVPRIILACVAALAAIYAVGLPYMAWVLNGYMGRNLSFGTILKSGCLIFLPWDALKIAATAILARILIPVLRRSGC
ncbi:MAG: biotin transporter BioY [Lachnospiraceae bacterium]|nr:biotin transporter BioY [Lachnospiraceae bacterium]